MSKKFWTFRNVAGTAELLLYGEISDITWWGDEVTPAHFAKELQALGNISELTVRINSGGGDVFAAETIGNQLETCGANVTCRIDGLCASAATIIACHCNRVIAGTGTTYMIHPVQMGIGYADMAKLDASRKALEVVQGNIVDLYARKTGRDRDEIQGWMDATSWWDANEAHANGFIDEVIESDDNASYENREGMLFVNSVPMGIRFDDAPEMVRNRKSGDVDKPLEEEGKTVMDEITTVEALRAAYPDLCNQIENAAIMAERQRIHDIDDAVMEGCEDLATNAKYTNPVSASAFAMSALKHIKGAGLTQLQNLRNDSQKSGAQEVKGAVPADGKKQEEDPVLAALNRIGTRKTN